MGNKIELFVIDYEPLPRDQVRVHANTEAVVGEGTMCGIKYGDFLYSGDHDKNGNLVFKHTTEAITCPHCIEHLELKGSYKKTKKGWI